MPTRYKGPKLILRGKTYTIRYYDSTKRCTTHVSLRTDDAEEAQRRFGEWSIERADISSVDLWKQPVDFLVAKYYRDEARHYPSHAVYKSAMEYVSKYVPGVTVKAFLPPLQRQFVQALRAENLAPGTINRLMSAVSTSIRRWFSDAGLSVQPKLIRVEDDHHRTRVLSDDEARTLLDACRTENDRRYVALALMTGARPQAIIGLTKAQFDFDHHLLDFLQPGKAQVKKKFKPVIPLPKALEDMARQWEDGPVFVVQTDHGTKLRTNESIWARIGKIKGVTPYVLRHTVAVELRRAGVPFADISGYLGHKIPGASVTERYARYDPKYGRSAAEAMDKYWRRINDGRAWMGCGHLGVRSERGETERRSTGVLDSVCVQTGGGTGPGDCQEGQKEPEENGGQHWDRTSDLRDVNAMLYL